MTSTVSAPLNAEQRTTIRRIEAFRQRFGEGHFYLACHAALPLALTPDLLYCLWVNFQQDSHQELLDIPWIAVSDLILSNLCEEVGYELYEMDASVRNELLKQLQHHSRFGLKRIREVADFVMVYVEQQLDSSDLDIRDFAKTQKWRALAYKNPAAAAHEIALALARLNLADKTEWVRMAELLTTLEEPLAEFSSLLTYASAMKDFARANKDSATTKFSQILDSTHSLQIAGVSLLIPKSIEIKQFQSRFNPASTKVHQINYLQRYFPWLAIGGLTLSLTLIYFLQSNQPLAQFLKLTQSPPSPSTTASSPTNFPTATPSADIPSPLASSTAQPSPSPKKISPSPAPNSSTTVPPTSVLSTSPTQQPNETAKPVSQAYKTLILGSRGSDVTKLQQQLRALGWDVPVDGILGLSTQQAIRDFQSKNGLPVDGVSGSATQDVLYNGRTLLYNGRPADSLAPETHPTTASTSPAQQPTETAKPGSQTYGGFRLGSSGSDVSKLQQRLRTLGWDVPVDGIFGSATDRAIRSFQGYNGLVADGIVGSATRNALYNGTSVAFLPADPGYPSYDNGSYLPPVSNRPVAGVNNRYVVVVPAKSDATLSQVRHIVPNAVYTSSNLGRYVWAGAFAEKEIAEARVTLLQANKLDAQVWDSQTLPKP